MRVRLRHSGGTARLELPDSATLDALRARAAELLGHTTALSLNKQTVLEGNGDATLKSLGICSGELVWALEAGGAPTQQAAAQREAAPPGPNPPSDPPAPVGPQPVAPVAPAAETAPRSVASEGPGPSGHEQAEAMDAEDVKEDDAAAEMHAPPSSLTVPGLLLRVLRSNLGAVSSSAARVLVLAAHAAMLESGFQPTADSGVVGRSGEDKAGPEQRCRLPPGSRASSSIYRLSYVCPEVAATSGGEAGRCSVDCSLMGGSVLLAARTPRGHLHHTSLVASDFVVVASPTGDEAGTSAEAEGGVALLPGNGLRVGSAPGLELSAAAVRRLWRCLKDSAAFPMLLATYADAGLPPPAGLLALPEELKQAVLERLAAADLAALSGCCTELRHLASQDELWWPLAETEFPSISALTRSQAAHRGWKWAYALCLRERRQREAAARRQRRRMFALAVPHFGPRPPFYPPHAPGGIAGITGGDYDRLPQPAFGTGPGMFGAGPSLGFLGGGGALRRQGGRGGGAHGLGSFF